MPVAAGILSVASLFAQEQIHIQAPYRLIAHRGGVVEGKNMENSIAALDEAIRRGYSGVEIDVRQSKDGVLYLYHNRTFARDYDSDKSGSEMSWAEISALRPLKDGGKPPVRLEDYCRYAQGKVNELMIDIKERRPSPDFYRKLEDVLKETGFMETSWFFGHGDYFRGKGKISMFLSEKDSVFATYGDKTKDYYFLFAWTEHLTGQTLKWCKDNGIEIMACANLPFAGKPEADNIPNAGRNIRWLKDWGITVFQIDSEYDIFFREK
ncbi:MAG: glycerophosphodiester phosphodiesterase family protein [Tannerella sp.]|nr:glycerophosphodiester phosphodiesterase family protein [Tannerella sp.]